MQLAVEDVAAECQTISYLLRGRGLLYSYSIKSGKYYLDSFFLFSLEICAALSVKSKKQIYF